MGFHITTSGGDEQWLTAGHCTDPNGQVDSWHHPQYGGVGHEKATWYVHNGVDVMRVGLNADDRASPFVYGSLAVFGAVAPTEDMPVCASLGSSNYIDCGTVTDAYLYWTISGVGTLYGGDYDGIATEVGDSGSPVYVYTQTHLKAIGIHNTHSGKFARVEQALSHWNASVYLP